MSRLKIASAVLAGLFLIAPLAIAGGVKEKGEKAHASEKAAEQKKVAAAHLPKDRKARSKDDIQKCVKGDEGRSDALEAKIKVEVTAVTKVCHDPKAEADAKKLEEEFELLAAALHALDTCAYEQAALETALAELIHEANELEHTANDLELLAYVLDSEELYEAVDVLDATVFELDLMIYDLDQAIDEMDGIVGDDCHADIFVSFEISIEVH